MKKQLLLLSALLLGGSSIAQVILYSEDFNSTSGTALAADWTQTTLATDGGFRSGTAASLSSASLTFPSNGTRFIATNDDGCNCNKSADFVMSPLIDLSSATAAILDVDIFFAQGTYQGNTEEAKIMISTDGGTTWSDLLTLDAEFTWRTVSVSLGSAIGEPDVKIGFSYDDNGGWLFGMGIDNFSVRIPDPNDAILVSSSLNRYAGVNTDNTLSMVVKNDGANAINSLTINWNDGTDHIQTIGGLNIAIGATATIDHPTMVNYAMPVEESIDITITEVNGNADSHPENNTSSNLINTVSQIVDKNVVLEEGTGTWCGWCPRGAVAMDYMETEYPDHFIGIAVHNQDPMAVTAYDNAADFSGYPSCNVDRVLLDQGVSQAAFEAYYNSRVELVPPAAISVVSSGVGTNVVLDVQATFFTPIAAANYRMGVIIKEDHVTGTTSGYNQTNYYAGGNNGPMGGYESLPSPVPAAQMVYDHVGRALVGGYMGQPSTVPATVADGTTATYTFNWTVPNGTNRQNMHAVAVLIDQTTGEIVNASQTSIAFVGIEENAKTIGMEVYPNPASDVVNVKFEGEGGEYTVTIMDLSGRQVGNSFVLSNATGTQSVAVPVDGLANGNYMVTVATQGASYTQQVVIK